MAASAAPEAVRPSTTLRLERRAVLVAAFARGDLAQADVAALLHCSASGARNYMLELVGARVIAVHPASRHQRCFAKQVFCLVPDAWRAVPDTPAQPPRRDPLVAALFGAS